MVLCLHYSTTPKEYNYNMSDNNNGRINQLKEDVSLFKPIVIAFIIVTTASTIFFHFVENWRWLDSFYFTIVTMATVGYGNFVPATDLGKIGNIVVIVVGIGIFTLFATQLIKRQGLRRLEKEATKRKP